MKYACHVHDWVNLLILPVLFSLTVAGLLGYVDTTFVSAVFTLYVLVDFLWIAAVPDAVPSLPKVILVHHIVTMVLLAFPLRYPQFGRYTCWDGLCEVNTFFLIARRQWRSWRTPFSVMYWATFFPMRILLYPYMLVRFYRELQAPQFSRLEVALCCGAQVVLILFNMVLLWLSLATILRPISKDGARGKLEDLQEEPPTSPRLARAYGSATAAVRLRASSSKD